jgi:hypothetical protein
MEQNFSENEVVAICNIPLSRYNQADKLIWRVTTSGKFSVKSAYHLEKRIRWNGGRGKFQGNQTTGCLEKDLGPKYSKFGQDVYMEGLQKISFPQKTT